MAGEKSANSRELDQTPTWAVAGVCAAIIIISIVLEKIIHKLGTWFTEKRKKALYEALDKVKAELMILGFISLILTFTQDYIAKICIPENVANSMLPCPSKDAKVKSDDKDDKEIGRRLLSYAFEGRLLAAVSKTTCKPGKVPLITTNGLHQIHILIFFLAVFHVLYSAATMALGKLKIRRWKAWEEETASPDYEFSADPSRFRLSHETSFVRAHSRFWTRIPIFFIIGCFFRQFFKSVIKSDYMTLRNGFISIHLAPGSKFNFQRYIKRSLEDDFKVVVGVSPVLWASCVVFLLVNVNGSRALFWASFIPLLIILAVGTKLQAILAQMAIEITERHAVVQGIPLVPTSDKYFWFGRPKLVLQLIHFALFQNAFQITYFLWLLYEKLNSCFKENISILSLKLSSGLIVLLLCSYSTLPLYALVAQMGSQMKKSIFDEQTSKALMNWHMAAKKKKGGRAGRSPTQTLGGDASPALSMSSASAHSSWNSPAATLHRFKTTGHSVLPIHDDHDMSDAKTATAKLIVRVDYGDTSIETTEIHPSEEQHGNEDEFSFAKPASLQ